MFNDEIIKFFNENTQFNPSIVESYGSCEQIAALTDYNIHPDHMGPYGLAEIVSPEVFSKISNFFRKNSIPFEKKKGLVNLCCDKASKKSEWIMTNYFYETSSLFLKLDRNFYMYELWSYPKGEKSNCSSYHFGFSGYCDACFNHWMDWNKKMASEKMNSEGDIPWKVYPEEFVLYLQENRKIIPSVDYQREMSLHEDVFYNVCNGLLREDFRMS